MKNAPLEKTSVQLPPSLLRDIGMWPGLTKSEAIRLSVERAHYLSTLRAEEIAGLAGVNGALLGGALEEFGYKDFRTIARSLPAIVSGYAQENRNISWPEFRKGALEPEELVKTLEGLSAAERIGVLDCVVAARSLPPETAGRKKTSRRPG